MEILFKKKPLCLSYVTEIQRFILQTVLKNVEGAYIARPSKNFFLCMFKEKTRGMCDVDYSHRNSLIVVQTLLPQWVRYYLHHRTQTATFEAKVCF